MVSQNINQIIERYSQRYIIYPINSKFILLYHYYNYFSRLTLGKFPQNKIKTFYSNSK